MNNNNAHPDKQESREVEFFVVNNDAGIPHERFDGIDEVRNIGTVIDRNSTGLGMLTHIPLQPGDMVRLKHGDTSSLGVVMWSIESSNKFRIQMKFV